MRITSEFSFFLMLREIPVFPSKREIMSGFSNPSSMLAISSIRSGGDDSLQTQMLLFRYFLPYALSVGGGFASAKLDTEFGSDSGTAPVFHFGYDYPITKNFQISLSYAWLGVNLAVQDTQSVTTTPTTTSSIQRRAVIGITRIGGIIDNNYSAFVGSLNGTAYDTRIVVTATIPTEATVQGTSTTTQSTEIKNLSTIKIVFRYSF